MGAAGMARRGMNWIGKARLGRNGKTGSGAASEGMEWQESFGEVRLGRDRRGRAWQEWHGTSRSRRRGWVGLGEAWGGLAGNARLGVQ